MVYFNDDKKSFLFLYLIHQMKKLVIIRHAKSDWSNLYLPDYERELNERGLRDAPMMGKRLHNLLSLDCIISSTAKRAAQTTMLITNEINYDVKEIVWKDELYHAPPDIITEKIIETENSLNNIAIVCHNPGITQFVNSQCGKVTDNIPTCGMVAFEIHCDKWEEFPLAEKRFLFFDYPKKNH